MYRWDNSFSKLQFYEQDFHSWFFMGRPGGGGGPKNLKTYSCLTYSTQTTKGTTPHKNNHLERRNPAFKPNDPVEELMNTTTQSPPAEV
jgi:hypothetical protein